jgi:hypothetical protein
VDVEVLLVVTTFEVVEMGLVVVVDPLDPSHVKGRGPVNIRYISIYGTLDLIQLAYLE